MECFSQLEARRYLLSVQGLWPPRALSGGAGILNMVRRLKCIQSDPIDIVGRNHEIALQARVKGFTREKLNILLYSERKLVEGWDKQMSFGPVEDRPYFAADRIKFSVSDRFTENGRLNGVFGAVRDDVESRGPLSSLDIDNDTRMDWSWAPARAVRAALEALWFRGELTIDHREGSRRYFDLTTRLLPKEYWDPLQGPNIINEEDSWPPSAESVLNNEELRREWRIARRIAAVGFLSAKAGDGWLGLEMKAPVRRRSIEELCGKGILSTFEIEGIKDRFYRIPGSGDSLSEIPVTGAGGKRAAVLAPLDNLLWDRHQIRQIFNFDYVWEVYKPEAERRWGYYVLPVLYGDRFVGRFEPGRDRKLGRMVIKRWWTEAGIRVNDAMIAAVSVALKNLAKSNGLESVYISPEASSEKILKSFLK